MINHIAVVIAWLILLPLALLATPFILIQYLFVYEDSGLAGLKYFMLIPFELFKEKNK